MIFKKARLKLTTLYLVIFMIISLSFSAFVYRGVTSEFQRRLDAIERRLELRKFGINPPKGQVHFFIQDLREAKLKVLFFLIYINGLIFVVSAFAGYFLAGKTLAPIEQALNEQRRFVADASHELKTPLTALQTSIEVGLRDRKMKLKDAKLLLKSNLEEINKLKVLATDLLSLARYQRGNNFVKEEINVKEVIESVMKNILPIANKKKLKIIVKSKGIIITANKESLEKLITILLDNAVKYSSKGGKVYLTTESSRRNLILKVKDYGIGIPNDHIPHIFNRFYRVDNSRSGVNTSGFGLGLSIAKKIVDSHNGSISVKSSMGKGSTFTVKLPF